MVKEILPVIENVITKGECQQNLDSRVEEFNAETIEAIKEAEKMSKDPSLGKTYKCVDELFEDSFK